MRVAWKVVRGAVDGESAVREGGVGQLRGFSVGLIPPDQHLDGRSMPLARISLLCVELIRTDCLGLSSGRFGNNCCRFFVGVWPAARALCRRRDGHAGRGGLPQQVDLRWGQGVGLVDEVAEGALQGLGFGGEGAGGFDGAGVFFAQGVDTGGGQRAFLAADTCSTCSRLGSGRAGVLAWCA